VKIVINCQVIEEKLKEEVVFTFENINEATFEDIKRKEIKNYQIDQDNCFSLYFMKSELAFGTCIKSLPSLDQLSQSNELDT